MSKKSFGIAAIKHLYDVSFDFDISNIYLVNGFGFFFLAKNKHCIGLIKDNGEVIFPWVGDIDRSGTQDGIPATFTAPTSLCYSKNQKSLFVIENNGKRIRKVYLENKYVSMALEGKSLQKLNSFFAKLSFNTVVDCDIDKLDNIIWSVKDLNRVFRFCHDRHEIEVLIGDGRGDFNIVSKLSDCSIRLPIGVKYADKSVLLCDSGNHCIRKISNNAIGVLVGNPTVSGDKDGVSTECLLSYPCHPKYSSNMLYFIDNQKVKQLSISDKSVKSIRSFDSEVLIETEKRDLFMLEKTI